MKTYAEALKPPRNGYKYSDKEQDIAQLAEMISHKHCVRAKYVYEWAIKHEIPLIKLMPSLMGKDFLTINGIFLDDLLDDKFDKLKSLIPKTA